MLMQSMSCQEFKHDPAKQLTYDNTQLAMMELLLQHNADANAIDTMVTPSADLL